MLLLLAWVLGFFAAIPIGATQVEIGKRAIANEISAALMVVAGSVISDVVYGAIALFGLAAFLQDRVIAGSFGLVGAGVLIVLAWLTFRNTSDAEDQGKPLSPALRSRRMSFVTGFSLAATNPPIMFWWLLGAKLATDLRLVDRFSAADSAAFILFGGMGLATYLALLVFVLRRVRHMIDSRTHRRIHRFLAILLVLLAAHLLFTALRDFAPQRSGGEIPAKPVVLPGGRAVSQNRNVFQPRYFEALPSGPTEISERFPLVRTAASYDTILPFFLTDSTFSIVPLPAPAMSPALTAAGSLSSATSSSISAIDPSALISISLLWPSTVISTS